MRTTLIIVAGLTIVIALLASSYLLFYDRLFPTTTPLVDVATPKPYIGVVQELPDLPPPAGVDSEPAGSVSPPPVDIPNAKECEGAMGSQLQQCCSEWGHRNKTVQVECIGSWQFVNNSCAYACTSVVPAPAQDAQSLGQ